MIYQKLDRLKFGILLFGIFVSSFGVLAFEISLTRIFSVMLDYHYTFLIISMALFGLGIGGLFAQRFSGDKPPGYTFSRLALMSIVFSFSTALFVIIAVSFPNLNLILATFLVLLPFSIAGMLLATCYKVFVTHSNVLHFADLGGAAVGALASVLLLNWIGAIMGILALSVAMSIASLFFAFASRKRTVIVAAIVVLTVMATLVNYSNSPNAMAIKPATNQGKEMESFLADSSLNAKIEDSRWSAFGQVDVLASPELPHNKVIFTDGGAGTNLYHFDGNFSSGDSIVSRLKYTTQYFPYYFAKKGSSLVIGPGGGVDVLTPLIGGVSHIYAVEVNPSIVDIVRDYSDYDGGIYTNYENVHISVDEGRSFLKRGNQKFDTIMLDIPITKTSQGTFGYALAENYLFTTDSFSDFLNHLNDDGFLTVVAHNQVEVYKLVSIALKVLSAQGLSNQEIMKRITIVGSGDNHDHSNFPIFMLKKTPINEAEAASIYAKANEIGLATLFTSYVINESSDPVLTALARDEVTIDELVSEAPFNMKAPTDDNPFFYNFELGVPSTLWAILVSAMALSGLVSMLYIGMRRHKEVLFPNGTKKLVRSKFSLFRWYCFASIGLGFMLIEIALIQKFILFLGEPTSAIAALIFSLLIAGGLGSFFSRKWNVDKQHYAFKSCLVIALIVIVYMLILPFILNVAIGYSAQARFLFAFALISPLGFLMGIPFPALLGYIKREPENDAAWMWCINGAFSFIAGSLALVVAMYVGFNAVLLLGALAYLGVFFVSRITKQGYKAWRKPQMG